jgi:hypothetical protein
MARASTLNDIFISSITNSPLAFGTNDTERMRIFSNGNVFIGSSPTDAGFKLDVNGTGRFSGALTANTFVEIIGDLRFNSNSADRSIYFRGITGSPDANWKMGTYLNPTGATTVTLAATVIDVFGGAAGYGFMVRNTSNASLLEIAGNTGAATFTSSSTVNGEARYGLIVSDNSAVASGNGGGVIFRGVFTGTTLVDAAGINAYKLNSTSNDFGYGLSFTTRANGGDLTSRLIINDLGNIGINTSSPGASTKLQVNGMALFTGGTFNPGDGTPSGVSIGYNTASNYGFIQAVETAVSNRLLCVQPNGGNVLIGTTTSGASKLRIVGLPTSSAGLSSGDVYNLAGVLMIA